MLDSVQLLDIPYVKTCFPVGGGGFDTNRDGHNDGWVVVLVGRGG